MSDERRRIGSDKGFLTSFDGIFKAVQFVLSLITLILVTSSHYWSVAGAGQMSYVAFVCSFCCITLLISGFIYYCKLYNGCCLDRLPWGRVELIFALGCGVLYFIAMCVSASSAQTFNPSRGNFDELFIASAIFSVITMIVFLVYAFLLFRGHKTRSDPPPVASV